MPMALEHALLVALSERPASGLELTRRFEKSIGFFWHATHQQIYRVLARMEADGWVDRRGRRAGRPPRQAGLHAVAGRAARCSAEWLADPDADGDASAASSPSSCAGRRTAIARRCSPTCATPAPTTPPGSRTTEQLEREQFPDPDRARPAAELDQWLVLRGGIRLEQFWIDWLTEYLRRPTHGADR